MSHTHLPYYVFFSFFSGVLYDMTGNYAFTFYVAGATLCLSGILVFVGCITKQRSLTSRDEMNANWSDQNED